MARRLTLALAQMDCAPGDLEKNLARVTEFTHRAGKQGAQIVAFPELILSGANLDVVGARIKELALTREDEPIQKLARAARDAKVYLLVGFLERRDNSGAVYNSLAFCAPNGTVVDTYAKTHMYTTERKYFSFGHQSPVYATEFGNIGILICYELCFPEIARIRALQGAEVLIAPAAWGMLDEMQWSLHVRTRALENLIFMAAINRAGVEADLHFIGQSMVVHPLGNVLAQASTDQEEMIVTTIDLDEIASARRRSEHWVDRRPELYGLITKPQGS